MNLGRIFARAIVRRRAVVLVAAALALLGMGRAYAVNWSDQGTAYAGCWADARTHVANATGSQAHLMQPECSVGNLSGSTPYYVARMYIVLSNGQKSYSSWTNNNHFFPGGNTCLTRPELTGMTGANVVCHQGCKYGKYNDPVLGDFYSTFNADTSSGYGVCTSTDAPEPKPDADGDGVPDEIDAFPNDPNEWADADGDGIGDNADVAPNDPDNGKDEGDGNETDNTAEGGKDCKQPPACKGDGIQCNTNWQIWRMRCNSAEVTGQPEVCGAQYGCVGDTAQCAQIALLRKTACDGVTSGSGGFGTGDSVNLARTAGALHGDPAPGQAIGPEEPGDAWFGEGDGEQGPDNFDTSGYGFGRSCPAIPPVNFFGKSITFDVAPICKWATLGGYIVVALAGLGCVRIISGRAA